MGSSLSPPLGAVIAGRRVGESGGAPQVGDSAAARWRDRWARSGGGSAGRGAGQTLWRRGDLTLPSRPCVSPQTADARDPAARAWGSSAVGSSLRGRAREAAAAAGAGGGRRCEPGRPAGNMATGGYRAAGGSTTDFLEEWKAKREKLRAKQNPPGPAAPGGGSGDAAGKPPAGALGTAATGAAHELNNLPGGGAAPAAPGGVNCAARRLEEEPPAGAAASASAAPPARGEEERDGAPEKGKSSGPSARKGKGQIEKRKLREKRRSTGVVNIPAAEVSRAGGGGRARARGCCLPRPPGRLWFSGPDFPHRSACCLSFQAGSG